MADEEKIGKVNIVKNLEGKYLVALQGKKININNKSKESEDYISIKQLKNTTSELFANDFLYDSIREKLIGITVDFRPDMNSVYDSILDMFSIGDYRSYLINKKKFILDIFEET